MEFDKSRVFTALNADDLKIGSKVIVANNIAELETNVECVGRSEPERRVKTLIAIEDKSHSARYRVMIDELCDNAYYFAYLVEEPQEQSLKWTELKVGDVIENKSKRFRYIITGIDYADEALSHIQANGTWCSEEELKGWKLVGGEDENN